MAALDTTSLSDEPALSRWWVVACLSAAALILLFAALIHQASKLSDTIITLTGSQDVQTTQPVGSQLEAQDAVGASTENSTELAVSEESAVSANTEISADVDVSTSLTEEVASAQIVINDAVEDASAPIAVSQNSIEETLALKSDDSALVTSIDEELLVSEEPLDTQESLTTNPEELPTELPTELTAASTDSEQASDIDLQLTDDSIAPQIDAPNTELPNAELPDTELVEEQVVPEAETTIAIDELAAASIVTDPTLVAPVLAELTSAESAEASESIASEESDELDEVPSSSELSLASLRRDVLTNMTRRSRLIRFETGTAELTPASSPLLEQTFEDLFLYAESDIVIEVGSLDGTDEAANQSLSNERAQAMREFLIERGIDGERLVISLLPDSGESARQQYINIQANL